MIARPHICLTCQYRLARRSSPSKTRVAFQSTNARLQRSTIVPDGLKVQYRTYVPVKRPLKLSRRPLGPPKTLSEHPLGKLYGFTGQQLRENREKLDVDVLGEATEVIVLRDSKISKVRHKYEEDVETRGGIDILAKLDEERGLVEQEEVERNINDFRPNDGRHPRTREQFSELLTGLQSGFTVSQLERYLQAHGQKDTAAPQLESSSLILRISPWMPGISESNDPLDGDQLRGYDLQSYTSKQRLVLRLLRECWKLELPFVEEGIGQIEVELNPGDLDLLLKGANSPLSSIHSKHIIGSEERLESFRSNDAKRSRNSIRITTTRAKSYLIIEEIDHVLRGIRRIRLPLKALIKEGEKLDFQKWANTQFDDSVIEELGRLTNTDIRKIHGGHGSSLFISSVEANPDSVFCTRPETARRLVLTSGNFSDRETSLVGCKDVPNAAQGNFVKYPLTEGLAWRDKLRQWSRWTVPVSKETEDQSPEQSTDSDIGDFEQQVAPEIAKPLDTPPQGAKLQFRPHVAYWSDELSVQSSALMGSVLYDHSQALSSTEGSQSRILFADAICSFSTSVPNISRILTIAVGSDRGPTERIVMRFLPNPFSPSPTKKGFMSSAALSAFPPIEMTFVVDPKTKVLRLSSIQAVISTENSDLMLPDSPVDIRFQQRVTKRLYCAYNSIPSGIAHFLGNSNLSLDFSQGGLNTPPSLMIPIASHLCNSPGFELLGSDKKDAKMQEIEYLFAGLEVRKTILMDFEGWKLVYTSVEAGKAGGRRGELRLHPTRTIKSDDPKLESEEAFLESAFRLADASYTPLKLRRVMSDGVRMVSTHGGKSPDKIFKYFAKRPTITYDKNRATEVDENTRGQHLEDERAK